MFYSFYFCLSGFFTESGSKFRIRDRHSQNSGQLQNLEYIWYSTLWGIKKDRARKQIMPKTLSNQTKPFSFNRIDYPLFYPEFAFFMAEFNNKAQFSALKRICSKYNSRFIKYSISSCCLSSLKSWEQKYTVMLFSLLYLPLWYVVVQGFWIAQIDFLIEK